jgi:hypothetical protein
MAVFTLELTDDAETVDFMDGTVFKVIDGGFDIGMPASVKQLTEVRPGFYRLSKSKKQYRIATITFSIHGATRTAIFTSLAKLERILNSIEGQEWISDTTRGELSYAFDGATTVTYFEVYAGDLKMPDDMLSVRVAHAEDDDGYYIQDLELKLYLSPVGYGLSIYDEPTTEVPLLNPSIGAKTTGGVIVKNLGGTSNYPYVEIHSSDVPGAQPYVTKLQVVPQATGFSSFYELYIGKVLTPFPTLSHLVFDSHLNIYSLLGGSNTSNGSALGGSYKSVTISSAPSGAFNTFASYAWEFPTSLTGMFLPFSVGFNGSSISPIYMAFGIDDYTTYGIRSITEVMTYAASTVGHFRMPAIQLPPTNPRLGEFGTLHEDLWVGVWYGFGATGTHEFDYIYVLPINNGVRVWMNRKSPGSGNLMVDDNWSGVHYNKNTSTSKVWQGFGVGMQPIKLTPGKTQRLYFASRGAESSINERARQLEIRLWSVPAFETLAY